MDLGLRVATQLKISVEDKLFLETLRIDSFFPCAHMHTHTHRAHTHFQSCRAQMMFAQQLPGDSLPSYHFLTIPWMPDFWLVPWRGGINSVRLNQQLIFRKTSPPPHFHHFALRKRGKPTPMGVSENDKGTLYKKKKKKCI